MWLVSGDALRPVLHMHRPTKGMGVPVHVSPGNELSTSSCSPRDHWSCWLGEKLSPELYRVGEFNSGVTFDWNYPGSWSELSIPGRAVPESPQESLSRPTLTLVWPTRTSLCPRSPCLIGSFPMPRKVSLSPGLLELLLVGLGGCAYGGQSCQSPPALTLCFPWSWAGRAGKWVPDGAPSRLPPSSPASSPSTTSAKRDLGPYRVPGQQWYPAVPGEHWSLCMVRPVRPLCPSGLGSGSDVSCQAWSPKGSCAVWAPGHRSWCTRVMWSPARGREGHEWIDCPVPTPQKAGHLATGGGCESPG